MTTRILVVDDQTMVREGFCALLNAQDGLQVVGDAADGRQAVRAVRTLRPDVVLMDIRMPGLDGIEATHQIMTAPGQEHPRVPVLTTLDLDDYVFEALRAGASGFLLKDARGEDLINAVRIIAAGERAAGADGHPPTDRGLRAPAVLRLLTPRETQVLVLIATGLSNAEIAAHLVLASRRSRPTWAASFPNSICATEPKQWCWRTRAG